MAATNTRSSWVVMPHGNERSGAGSVRCWVLLRVFKDLELTSIGVGTQIMGQPRPS
jgi:hypothetical protein